MTLRFDFEQNVRKHGMTLFPNLQVHQGEVVGEELFELQYCGPED